MFWAFIKKLNDSARTALAPFDAEDEPQSEHPENYEGIWAKQTVDKTEKPNTSQDSFDLIIPQNQFYSRDAHWLIGGTGSMEILKKKVANAATIESHVLIIGEAGTGKEIVARAIHSLSHRTMKRFVGVNCGVGIMVPETLDKELWGIEVQQKCAAPHITPGLFESCHDGTIFLDNIQDMTLMTQGALLKALSNKTITRKGGKDAVPADVRVITACPGDVTDELKRGTFSREFYDLVTAFVIRIPSLRERKDDIAPLCSYFMDKFGKEYDKQVRSISDDVLSVFHDYSFPGNVQELANLIERAVLLLDGPTIELKHLPEKFREPDHLAMTDDHHFMTLDEVEKRYITKVVNALGQNRTKAADVLGISRGALWRKLKQIEEEK
jgi:DNA-binding NtrC family response regulator